MRCSAAPTRATRIRMRDGLRDGDEVSRGTDPLKPDTDNDLLRDGQEAIPPCPNPLNPDTDADGIIDGRDLDPCDPSNPRLTQTANAGVPTVTKSPVPVITVTPTAAAAARFAAL